MQLAKYKYVCVYLSEYIFYAKTQVIVTVL